MPVVPAPIVVVAFFASVLVPNLAATVRVEWNPWPTNFAHFDHHCPFEWQQVASDRALLLS